MTSFIFLLYKKAQHKHIKRIIYIDCEFVLNANMLVKLWKQKGFMQLVFLCAGFWGDALSSPNNFTRMYSFVFSVKPLEYKAHAVILILL